MSREHDGWVKRWETEIQPLLRTWRSSPRGNDLSMQASVRRRRLSAAWLLVPGLLVLALLMLGPLVNLLDESLREFVSGHVGAAADATYTLAELHRSLRIGLLLYIADTFRISLIATTISIVAGLPGRLSHRPGAAARHPQALAGIDHRHAVPQRAGPRLFD